MRDHLVSVDVGTASARAGVFATDGRLLAKASHPIEILRPRDNHAEHDSENIWSAVCLAVKRALADSGIHADRIAAIGFDATCSLVVRDGKGLPVTVSSTGQDRFDTIMWLDHRALAEAAECTATAHPVLRFAGGAMSPEMEMPKLMWLKRRLPESWARIGLAFDLADFLTWRASGSQARSCSTLTAKWNFLSHEERGWQHSFLDAIGLSDLTQKLALPDQAQAVGELVGTLSAEAAAELGLDETVVVASGMIDAYAGALGLLGGFAGRPDALEKQVGLIAGTSSCIVSFAGECRPLDGFWGPYFGAGLRGLWLTEGGQSATGALLDHMVLMHAAGGEPDAERHGLIIRRIAELKAEEGPGFADGIDILPDFHGNRSPYADPNMRGMISGLTLDRSFDGLCRLYWRTCVAIALQIRHILDALRARGDQPEVLHLAGGHSKNPLLTRLYADVTRCRVVTTATDPVLLGTAMNAASAARLYGDLASAGAAMAAAGQESLPDPATAGDYDRDYRRFQAMIRHRAELSAIS